MLPFLIALCSRQSEPEFRAELTLTPKGYACTVFDGGRVVLASSASNTTHSGQSLEALRHLLNAFRVKSGGEAPSISTGCGALDRLLPWQGLPAGGVIEWLGDKASGAALLSFLALAEVAKTGALIVVSDPAGDLYLPALWALGMRPAQLLIVRAKNSSDEIWALVQALRCREVGAAWACLDRLTERDARKLQLAAEEGNSRGLWLRPARAQGRPSWSELQLLVEPERSPNSHCCWRVTITRLRQGVHVGQTVRWEIGSGESAAESQS